MYYMHGDHLANDQHSHPHLDHQNECSHQHPSHCGHHSYPQLERRIHCDHQHLNPRTHQLLVNNILS